MYSWGGDTGDWKGKKSYDFGSARARYDKIAADAPSKRVYTARSRPDISLVDTKGKIIKSDSKNPIIIATDVTGSMNTWPAEIFDRLPLAYQTLSKYREDVEFSFSAIGDATCDQYPLQINDFGKGLDLENKVKALYGEGGGGGHITESYELFGYHALNHCEVPNATSPFLLIFGDEAFYDKVSSKQIKHYIGDSIGDLDSKDMWKSLMQKFNVYYLQKPYGNGDNGTTKEVRDIWGQSLGKQRVIALPSMERAVDVAIGLIAKHWGEYTDFKGSLDARHDDADLKASVHHSLRYVDADPAPVSHITKSTISKSKVTKSILDK